MFYLCFPCLPIDVYLGFCSGPADFIAVGLWKRNLRKGAMWYSEATDKMTHRREGAIWYFWFAILKSQAFSDPSVLNVSIH